MHSPFHNMHQDATKLFDYLDNLKEITPEKVAREHLFAVLFPDQPFDDLKLRHITSYLFATIESFMANLHLQEEKVDHQILLLQSLSDRSSERLFTKASRKARKQLEKKEHRDSSYLLQQYRIQMTEAKYSVATSRNDDVWQKLSTMSADLDLFYIAEKLRVVCTLLSYRRLFKYREVPPIPQELLQRIALDELWKNPIIGIYYYIYRLEVEGDDRFYYKLTDQLHQHDMVFPQDERRDLYLAAINFCVRKINMGEKGFLEDLWGHYRSGLESGALLEKGELSPWTYKNVAVAAIKLNKLDWADNFVEEYRPLVEKDYRDSMYAFNKAQLLFIRKEYRLVIRTLQAYDAPDILTRLGARSMTIKSWFELGDIEALDYALNNLQQLLKRKEILTYHKQNYTNLIRMVRKLIDKPQGKAIALLQKEIEETEILTERDWLQQKLTQS